jgi:aspartokinase
MENKFYVTLLSRRDDLLNELKHIEELIKIYQNDASYVVSNTNSSNKNIETKSNNQDKNVKQQIIDIIKSLGEEFQVSDLTKALHEREPKKATKAIGNRARNYIYILKNDGILEGRVVGKNKYVYKIVNK